MTWFSQPPLSSSPDTSSGSDPAEPDISADELKWLCQEYLARLQVDDNLYYTNVCVYHYAQAFNEQISHISVRTVNQDDEQSGEWLSQHQGRVTASSLGEIIKEYTPLVIRFLNAKSHTTKAMR